MIMRKSRVCMALMERLGVLFFVPMFFIVYIHRSPHVITYRSVSSCAIIYISLYIINYIISYLCTIHVLIHHHNTI